jgi:hypothetical protein
MMFIKPILKTSGCQARVCFLFLVVLSCNCCRQTPLTGQVAGPLLQLHPGGGCCPCPCMATLLLCLAMIWPMLGIHLYDTLTLFLLIIFDRGCDGGKQESINSRNFAPTLVETFWENGGLNQVIFLDLLQFPLIVPDGGSYLSWCSYPLLSRASWYCVMASLNTLSILFNLLFTAAGIFLMILGGWLLLLLMYMGVLLGFMKTFVLLQSLFKIEVF